MEAYRNGFTAVAGLFWQKNTQQQKLCGWICVPELVKYKTKLFKLKNAISTSPGEKFPTLRHCTRLWPFFSFCCFSAYEQKQPAGMKPSSPVTPPCSTPVSPLHHASPTAAPTPKPDRTYVHIPPSQPLPDNAYSMDHRYCSLQPFPFPSHLHEAVSLRTH